MLVVIQITIRDKFKHRYLETIQAYMCNICFTLTNLCFGLRVAVEDESGRHLIMRVKLFFVLCTQETTLFWSQL